MKVFTCWMTEFLEMFRVLSITCRSVLAHRFTLSAHFIIRGVVYPAPKQKKKMSSERKQQVSCWFFFLFFFCNGVFNFFFCVYVCVIGITPCIYNINCSRCCWQHVTYWKRTIPSVKVERETKKQLFELKEFRGDLC